MFIFVLGMLQRSWSLGHVVLVVATAPSVGFVVFRPSGSVGERSAFVHGMRSGSIITSHVKYKNRIALSAGAKQIAPRRYIFYCIGT